MTSPGPEPCATWIDYNVTMTGVASGTAAWTNAYGHTGTLEMTATLALPVNLKQVEARAAKGLLEFRYEWEATTGSTLDLAGCIVDERVVYPGANPYEWPDPPFTALTPNPTILSFSAAGGAMVDTHSYGDEFSKKLKKVKFTARQDYRYKCAGNSYVTFPKFANIPIIRKVYDTTGRGCFVYMIEKSGKRAYLDPIPGVKKKLCKAKRKEGADLVSADVLESGGLEASLSAVGSSAGLNEPHYLRLSIRNGASTEQRVEFGMNSAANIRVVAIYPSGRKVEGTIRRAGIGAPGDVRIAPGAAHSVELLLNEWFLLDEAGEYRIEAALADGPSRPFAVLASASTTIRIVDNDWSRLREITARLAATAVGPEPIGARIRAAEVLSYMRHPAAVEGLAKIVRQAPLVAPIAIAGLARIRSTEARAALSVARNAQDPDVAQAASAMLQYVERSDSKSLNAAD